MRSTLRTAVLLLGLLTTTASAGSHATPLTTAAAQRSRAGQAAAFENRADIGRFGVGEPEVGRTGARRLSGFVQRLGSALRFLLRGDDAPPSPPVTYCACNDGAATKHV